MRTRDKKWKQLPDLVLPGMRSLNNGTLSARIPFACHQLRITETFLLRFKKKFYLQAYNLNLYQYTWEKKSANKKSQQNPA